MKRKILLLILIWLLACLIAYLTTSNIPDWIILVSWLSLFLGIGCQILFMFARVRQRKNPTVRIGYFAPNLLPGFGLLLILLVMPGLLLEKPLHDYQGDIYKAEGKYPEAISQYQKGSPTNPDTRLPEVYLLAGDQQLALSHYGDAQGWYFKTLKVDAFSQLANRRLLGTYLLESNHLSQLGDFTGAIASNEAGLNYLNPAGETAVLTSRLTFLQPITLIELYGRLETNYRKLGQCFLEKKDFEQAVDSYKQALQININSDSTSRSIIKTRELISNELSATNLAWGQDLENRDLVEGQSLDKFEDQILTKYQAAIENGTNSEVINKANQWSATIIFRKGDRELRAGNFEKAISYYQRTVDEFRTSPTYLRIYLSKTYLSWGKKLLAENNFEAALAKLEPNYALFAYSYDNYEYQNTIIDCYLGIGNNLLAAKKYDEAIARLEPVFTSYPKATNTERLQNLVGQAYFGQGAELELNKDYLGAIESYQKALLLGQERNRVSPGLIRVYFTLGNEAFGQKDFTSANQHYQKAQDYALNSGDTATYTALSQKLSNISNIQSGQRSLNFYLSQGAEFESAGNYPQAIESFEQALVYTSITSDFATRYDLYLRLLKLYSNKGTQLLEKARNYSEAADSFEQGLLYAQLLDNTEAKASFSFSLVTTHLAEVQEVSDQLEAAQKEEDRLQAEVLFTLAEVGLIGCSLIPVIGVFCYISLGIISVWNGDWVGVGLSIIGAIPLLGDLANGGSRALKATEKLVQLQQKIGKTQALLEEGQKLISGKSEKFLNAIKRADKLKWNGPVKINFLEITEVGAGKEFTQAQKQAIIAENKLRNGGVLRSDCSGKILVESLKALPGIAADLYAAEVDHIIPKSLGGSNSFSNAQVLSKAENLAKGNLNQVCPLLVH